MTEIDEAHITQTEVIESPIQNSIEENQGPEVQLQTQTQEESNLENSYIVEVTRPNPLEMLDRYTKSNTTYMKQKIKMIEESNFDKIGKNFDFLKKKSKLELEKEKAKEMNKENVSNINKIIKTQQSTVSIGDNFIRKKSKLELEKEQFAELLCKAKEEQLKKKTNSPEETVVKLEDCVFNLKEKETSQVEKKESKILDKPTIVRFVCGICNLEGEMFKGKLFPKCKHYFHNVS